MSTRTKPDASANDSKRLRDVWQKLSEYCAARSWRGIDPYDGLNSPLACLLPGKVARQAWTQLHRRSPINLRPLCGIKPTLNSKTLALAALGSNDDKLLDELEKLRTPEGGWGYPFAWQSRAFFAARNTPNLICTVVAARAYKRWERKCDISFLEKYLLRERGGERWFAYVPQTDAQVHNINMLGAALLGRRDCMEFSVKRQRADGSWPYGEAENQQWIDNFHTGYNLVALQQYERRTGDHGFVENMERGFAYWDKTFWSVDGAPRYYHNQDEPVDIHCCAQGILTYLEFGHVDKARRAAIWAIENMWDNAGFFWYQRGRYCVNRLSYMRWSQAWMYCALAELLRTAEMSQ